ncbi:MAG: spondin domain-containing protein [Acidobacteriales bacterium]|nr:spondin domain-containing protein [Terriglobales bacterium]
MTHSMAQRFGHIMLMMLAVITIGIGVRGNRALAQDSGQFFEVAVTNLTQGQRFTPILVATHKKGLELFELGRASSSQLEILAEDGDTAPLTALLLGMPEVLDVTDSGSLLPMGLLSPGGSVTLSVRTRGAFDHISVAAMLIPTNDAFFALNGVAGPKGNKMLSLVSPAYDAGTERNDEICRPGDPKGSIPGPDCMTPPPSGLGTAENFVVHIHSGIHGVGGGVPTSDLNPATRDWRNPVAKITIRRVH